MDFYEVLDQLVDLLKQRERVTYRAIKRQFNIDDEFIEDLKAELIQAQRLAIDEDGAVLVWTGETEATPVTASQADQPGPQPVIEQVQPVQATQPIESHTPEAERRQLTVMFVDLVGSTALSGRMDAEDYRELVRAYQTTCGEVIQRFDCHIAQTLGDGLLIYSGYPVAHENDAERAVRVGLGILDAMKTLNERLEQDKGVHLAVRVGIHTGPVVVGEVGAGSRQEQLALGETPNVAARIQGIAQPDTIVISEATYRLIQGYFDCQELGEQHLRGVFQSIRLYQVFRESGAQSRLDIVSRHGLTPLVGREQEVGLLLERWQQAKEGQGQVVLLSGEAGIGKSRLVQVLKEHIADASHTLLECRSSPYYQNTALYPITDLLQRALQWQQDDTPEQRLEKLEQMLSPYRLPLAEAVPLFAPLLSLSIPEARYAPLALSPQRQRQKTLETLVAMLLELAEQQVVLFILEDVHWTDPTTLDLLELLLDQTPTASLYALLTCRPEFQPSWSHRSYLTEVTVNRLSRNQIERMAEQVTGGKTLPAEIIQQLVDKTDGVPLYVEEMTKAVLESGFLKESDEQYELTGPVSSLSIPATLQDSLMGRLDRLVTAKGVAQYAAVIGRRFSYVLLREVSQLDEATLKRELGRLVDAELVYQRGTPPQATYTFKHALIQDTAYGSLLRSTRQQYHAKIATVWASQFPDTAESQPELLAHHYMEAGLDEQAIGYWQQAGERAIKRSANMEAIGHLTKGLEIVRTLPETPEHTQHELLLLTTLGPALIATKSMAAPEVEPTYARARALCQQVGETPQLFPTLWGLYWFYLGRGVLPTAREIGEQLYRLAQRVAEPMHLLQAHNALGATFFYLGDYPIAWTHLEQGITLTNPEAQQAQAHSHGAAPGVRCLAFAALTLWSLGYPAQAMRRGQEALTLAQKLAHPYSLALVQHLVAILLHRCRAPAVQVQADALLTLATVQKFPLYVGVGIFWRGWTLTMQGQNEAGMVQMHQGMAAVLATGHILSRPLFLVLLAEAAGHADQVGEGMRLLAEALTILKANEQDDLLTEVYRLQGELLLRQTAPDTTQAESCFHQAITIAQNQSAKSWELRAATSLARLWQSQGKRNEARELLAPVYGWFTEGFDTADLIDAKALLDELS